MFYSVSSNVVLPKEFVDFNQKNKKINWLAFKIHLNSDYEINRKANQCSRVW
jgi:hypothetical protein